MRQPTDLYTERAESYARGRPGYPLDALAPLASIAGITPPAHVADVGSGTGNLAGSLLRIGYRVHAIEPNAAMRAVADRRFRGHPGFRSVAATAEHTPLPDHSMHAITAGQSLHWFDLAQARVEFTRILRPGGALLAVWNEMKCTACAFCLSLDSALSGLLPAYVMAKADEPDPVDLVTAVMPPGTSVHLSHARYSQQLTHNGLWHRIFSTSYAPGPDGPAGERLRHALAALYRDHRTDGVVTLHYVTTTITAAPALPEGTGQWSRSSR